MTSEPSEGVLSISVREAQQRLAAPGSDAVLLDVREPEEYRPRRAAGARSLPMSQLRARLHEVPRDREVLVICEHGARSLHVTRYLRQQGIARAVDVAGGTDAWERSNLPMERGTGG